MKERDSTRGTAAGAAMQMPAAVCRARLPATLRCAQRLLGCDAQKSSSALDLVTAQKAMKDCELHGKKWLCCSRKALPCKVINHQGLMHCDSISPPSPDVGSLLTWTHCHAQVGAETSSGLDLSDLLRQPINTRADADTSPGPSPRSGGARYPPPRSPPRPPHASTLSPPSFREPAPARLDKKPTLTQRMRDSVAGKAAVSKAEHQLKGFFANAASKLREHSHHGHDSEGPAPTLAGLRDRAPPQARQQAATPPAAQQMTNQPRGTQLEGRSSRGRESLGLDLSMLGFLAEPTPQTHRRMASDAESASGGDALSTSASPEMTHPQMGDPLDPSHTQLLASPIGGLVGSPPRSFKRQVRQESSPQQQQQTPAADPGLLDDLLDLIPSQSGWNESADAGAHAPSRPGSARQNDSADMTHMRSITSLQEWVGGADDAAEPDRQVLVDSRPKELDSMPSGLTCQRGE